MSSLKNEVTLQNMKIIKKIKILALGIISFCSISASAQSYESYVQCEDTCRHIHGIDLSHYQGEVFWEAVGDNSKMAYVYLKENGKVRFATVVGGSDTAYPVRYADHVLYTAGNHEFCSYFVSEETQGVMVKDSVMESFDENGTATYIGFLREKNTFDNDEEIDTDSDQIFKEKTAEYGAAAVVDFTVVE